MPPVGAVLILLSFHHAAGQPEPDQLQFALFWAGFLLGMLPLVALACDRHSGGASRTWALVGIGLFGMVPRLLQYGPAGPDEYAHWRQSLEAFLAGDVGHSNYLLPITREFPGLHQAGSAIARLAGMPLWPASIGVVVLAHILSVLAIYQLVRMVGAPARGAAAGAVIYTLNPSWLYFNSAFSYESLALPLMIWCLAATVAAGRASRKINMRALAMAVFCVASLPVIHHLTSILLCLMLMLLIVVRVLPFVRQTASGGWGAEGERFWPPIFIGGCLLVSITFWWSGLSGSIVGYLGPEVTRGFAQLQKMLDGINQTSSHRSLFENSLNPPYEIVCGYLFPIVLFAMFSWSLIVLWRNRRRLGSAPWAFAGVGSMFFASMPLLVTGGAEGAHRSWGYSFIGIAVVCGLAWSHARDREADDVATRWRSLRRVFGRPGVTAGVVGILFTVLAFGSAAVGVKVTHRFPGSAEVGDDGRSVSRESAAVASWLAAHAPVDTRVMTDRFSSLQIGSPGRMATLRPSTKFPVWDMYMSPEPVRLEVLKQIFDSKIKYFVVDSRMATTRPQLGIWFTREEPGAKGPDVYPQAAIDRFNCLPWLRAVYAAGPLTVYEVNTFLLRRTRAGSCEGSGG
ncbi:hypothetical protein A5724_07090 [Mycobacterium sp. ACS1612]|uniref:hypothetical protein n=1 Tax=Mycobacterium sp. ACS1612 TaxID=1834117 RepID=UPI0007FE0F84|nr:hypothetical protein [Mycobacterium sp. ACS1612]OBF40813.1 hypothetical protein A5724_07090 [Mycobacterium sp. ACS1612]